MKNETNFVLNSDFFDAEKLSIFVARLKAHALINIETLRTLDNKRDLYRVWYYNV